MNKSRYSYKVTIHRYGGIAAGEGGAYTWTPEDAIATELEIFKGRDIMPRRDIPSPEELVFQEILKNNPEYKELVKKKAKENRWFGRYGSKIDLEKDLKNCGHCKRSLIQTFLIRKLKIMLLISGIFQKTNVQMYLPGSPRITSSRRKGPYPH